MLLEADKLPYKVAMSSNIFIFWNLIDSFQVDIRI